MIAAICAPYSINGQTIVIGAIIGIAVIDRNMSAAPPTSCAMPTWRSTAPRTRAATAPASTTRRWTPTCSKRKLLESDLREAIENDDLQVAYQPIVNNSGETVVGVEALCRWTHPDARRNSAQSNSSRSPSTAA